MRERLALLLVAALGTVAAVFAMMRAVMVKSILYSSDGLYEEATLAIFVYATSPLSN
jgi:hypothetical protein